MDATPPPSPRAAPAAPGWTEGARAVFGTHRLTAAAPRAPDPPGFVGRLWPPQATLLRAMLDLEAAPELPLVGDSEGDTARLRCESGRIAAEFSFGKTVLCVALVCAAPLPRERPRPLNFLLMAREARTNCLAVTGPPGRGGAYLFKPQGRGAFPRLVLNHPRLYPATLVVAAPSVISQWEECIRAFAPGLAFCTIENVRTLRDFHARFHAERAAFDLVLLKAGKVTTTFRLPGEPPLPGRQRPLTAALAAATEGWVWGRMVVDDFDTIRLSTDDIFVPARFTWVVSATARSSNVGQDLVPAPTPAAFLRANSTLKLLGAALDDLFNRALKLQCAPEYVRDHITSTVAHFRRVVVAGGRAVGILQDLGVPAEVLEMAAAGALETAAEHLSIKVATLGELVEKVLEARTEKYRTAVRVLRRVAAARGAAVGGEGDRPAPEEVKAFRAALKGGDDAAAAAALGRVGGGGALIAQALRSLEEWAEKEKEEHGGRLHRMRENIREACCQACAVPIEDESYIVNCCQVVICGYCTLLREGGRCRYISRCPNCAQDVDVHKSLIYVGKDLDLEGGLADDEALFLRGGASPPPPEPAPPPAPRAEPRLGALLQLLRGEPPDAVEDQRGLPPLVDGLLAGLREVPHPPGVPRKFLIFAMHPESTRHVLAALGAEGIPAVRLSGKRAEKNAAVARFKDPAGTDVMVATSSRDCAGLHLPEVSTLIFYNRHVDREVAKQAIGRAQRVGRAHSLEVIEIVSEGENDRLLRLVPARP
jgi:hypothetical protein